MKNSQEVIFNNKDIYNFSYKEIKFLKQKCEISKRGRFRVCMHHNIKEKTQEMIICHKKKSYIHPHKHPKGISESYHMIEGRMKIFFFKDNGEMSSFLELSSNSKTKPFMYRLSKPIFHLVYPLTKFTIYHEVTTGPFIKSKNVIFAKFAPKETDSKIKIKKFFNFYKIK